MIATAPSTRYRRKLAPSVVRGDRDEPRVGGQVLIQRETVVLFVVECLVSCQNASLVPVHSSHPQQAASETVGHHLLQRTSSEGTTVFALVVISLFLLDVGRS